MQRDYDKYMKLALSLAEKGKGKVSPNPLVGCVIVKEFKIVGKGFHKIFGEAHAEINALAQAGNKACGATMFVNLEPCCHYGKTPPCTDKIISSGLKEVIIGIKDPNPLINGKGIRQLKAAGIKLKVGVLARESSKLNQIYLKYITKKIPFVILKTALSLDGKIATRTGDSKWISSESSRSYVHTLRSQVDAILVGINTILKDNPELTVRDDTKKIKTKLDIKMPIRIIVDSRLKIPLRANVLNKKVKTIIATTKRSSSNKIQMLRNQGIEVLVIRNKNSKVDLKELLKNLGKLNISSVLVEGGGNINASMLEERLVDKVLFFVSPKIIGGKEALTSVEGEGIDKVSKAINLKNIEIRRYGEDILIEGNVKYDS